MTEKKDKKAKKNEETSEAMEETKSELTKEQLLQQFEQLSIGYQQLLGANQTLNQLVNKYEEMINVLTARLLEARTQP